MEPVSHVTQHTETLQYVGKKDFRKEITKLKREIKNYMSLTKAPDSAFEKQQLEEIKSRMFECIDHLPILFMNRRKKVSGADNPAKNLIGFGKPAFVDQCLIDFFVLNFGNIENKSFREWFPILSEHGIGSRIQLQSLLNLMVRITNARIKGNKKRQQISVTKMKDMDKMIEKANQILSLKNKPLIQNSEVITSSDILKILNVFVSKDSDITMEQIEKLEKYKEGVRNENVISKNLLDGYIRT
jgi:hypothetical protein